MLGNLFSSILSRLWGDKERRILILGLDGAGKTTILYRYVSMTLASLQDLWCYVLVGRLQLGEVVTTIPSTCFTRFLCRFA